MGFVMYSALCALFCLSATSAQLLQGIVKMQGPSNYVTGNLTLSQNDKGPVTIYGRISGLTPGLHGFHIHEKGDITGGCGSTGSHYNPYKKQHGNIKDTDRHLGDLGNIEADSSGIATISIQDSLISLTGPNAIIGRSLVVHADADDLGKGRGESLQNGNAGPRVACGVVGILSPVERWPSNSASSLAGASISILLSVVAFFLTKY